MLSGSRMTCIFETIKHRRPRYLNGRDVRVVALAHAELNMQLAEYIAYI